MGDPGAAIVGHGSAQVLLGDLFVGDRLDHIGTRDEHVRRVLDHQVEVGDGGRIDGASRARPQNGRDLGDHARGQGVPQEDVGVSAKGGDALLNASAPRIVQPDHGSAHLHGQIHDLADLQSVRLRKAPAEDREVLGEDEDETPFDSPETRDHAVARNLLLGHAEVRAAMLNQLVEFLEGSFVEQDLDALARSQPTLPMLSLATVGASSLLSPANFVAKKGRSISQGWPAAG